MALALQHRWRRRRRRRRWCSLQQPARRNSHQVSPIVLNVSASKGGRGAREAVLGAAG